jgi:hypothetical protein
MSADPDLIKLTHDAVYHNWIISKNTGFKISAVPAFSIQRAGKTSWKVCGFVPHIVNTIIGASILIFSYSFHKPFLRLSIMDLIAQGLIRENLIEPSFVLVEDRGQVPDRSFLSAQWAYQKNKRAAFAEYSPFAFQ